MPARPELPGARALARLYSTAAERPVLEALCGIEREIRTSLKPGLDHQVAHTRLAWWREECARCARGEAMHPLTRELTRRFAPGFKALAGLTGFVDTAAWDLAAATFETRRELSAYCERWSAALVELLALHAAPGVPRARVRALGRSLRELDLLLALADDARAGRLRLPLDELARARAAPESLALAPWPADLVELVRARHRELRCALAAGVAGLAPDGQAPLRGLLVWAAIAARTSERAQRHLPRVLPARHYHAPLDGWRAWRAARRADAGRLRLRTA
jgi:phytoene synthase